MDLIVKVKEIKGICPVYKSGDTFVIKKGYVLDTTRSSPVCMHSLASLMPYYVALSKGVHPKDLGLSGTQPDCAYVQCLDPYEITGGGTVILEVYRKQ
jgi:uncharacterized repeat protein (TIGR04076 family)